MTASKYNSEGYYDPTTYEALSRIEREERVARYRPFVYICSPYSHGCINTNIENARKYSRFAVDRRYLPITPHIYFTQFMDDTVSEEHETAIFMNFVLMSKCAELWVFGDIISKGMQTEIERAERKHMKIRYFTEELEEKE